MNLGYEHARKRIIEEKKKFIIPTDPEEVAEAIKNDPCYDLKKIAYTCIDSNLDNPLGDRACSSQLQSHITCVRFWRKIEYDRRRKNIRPYRPRPEDREKILEQYKNFGDFFGKNYFDVSPDPQPSI